MPILATYADLDRTPDDKLVTFELIGGVLYHHARPRWPHCLIQGEFPRLLDRGFRAEGWGIVADPELRLEPDGLVPDLAAWRLPYPPLRDDEYMGTAPVWVCEILSPVTAEHDWERKVPAWFRHGVEHVWMLDPARAQFHVLGPHTLDTHEGTLTVRLPPFDVPVDLGALWGRLLSARQG